MIEYRNVTDCNGCAECIGCGRRHQTYIEVENLVCDRCKHSVDELIEIDGEQLCRDCLEEEYRVITFDNAYEFVEE